MCGFSSETLSPLTTEGEDGRRKYLDILRINLQSERIRLRVSFETNFRLLASVAVAHTPEKSLDGSAE